MLMKRAITTALMLLTATAAFSADIIIESRPGGKNYTGYKEIEGHWLSSNNPAETAKSSAPDLSPQSLGSRRATVTPDSGAPADAVVSAARFTPTIETPGDYYVYVTFPRGANATPVTVSVKSSKGEEKKQITQDGWGGSGASNANEWLEIGKFPFTKAGDQYAEIQVTGATGAADSRNNPQAYADAVRFTTDQLPNASQPGAAAPGKSGAPIAEATAPAAAYSGEIKWASDLTAARADAAKSNKKMLVFFYSPQSSRSTDYESKVINDAKVKGVIMDGFVPVKVNMDTQRQLSAQLQVFRAGTVNVYDSATGNGLEHISDTPNAGELVKRLNAVK